MSSVGIIANPASGKDIRRLVAYGSNFDNDEKVAIVRRVLLGLDAVGVEHVWLMPDSFGIGRKALAGLALRLEATLLPLPAFNSWEDSRRAAEAMARGGAGCIVTLGGDGTNRAVAQASGAVPLLPVSTGTNNVFPLVVEGTIAGIAAGLVARGFAGEAVRQAPRLEILPIPAERAGAAPAPCDIALIDAAVYAERFVGARALWDVSKVRQVVLARAEPGCIGLAAIGSHLPLPALQHGEGLYLRLGAGGRPVLAPIAPGLVRTLELLEYRLVRSGEELLLQVAQPCVLALDGERELELGPGAAVCVRLSGAGPLVVDPRRAIAAGAAAGAFMQDQGRLGLA